MSTMTLDLLLDAPRPALRRPVRSERPLSTVRLTRPGRVVVFVVGLVALLGIGFLVANGAGAALDAGTPEPTHTIVVAPGDTLWDLASEAAGGDDVRAMITHIEQLNGLAGASLSAGQSLRIPD